MWYLFIVPKHMPRSEEGNTHARVVVVDGLKKVKLTTKKSRVEELGQCAGS
jgi:hypothetical protein